jgi:hypothetical protein
LNEVGAAFANPKLSFERSRKRNLFLQLFTKTNFVPPVSRGIFYGIIPGLHLLFKHLYEKNHCRCRFSAVLFVFVRPEREIGATAATATPAASGSAPSTTTTSSAAAGKSW